MTIYSRYFAGTACSFLLLFLLLLVLPLSAQQHSSAAATSLLKSVVSAGAVSSTGTMQLRGTIGQPVIGISSDASTIAHEGFWYGLTSSTTSIGELFTATAPDMILSVYPNPFSVATSVSIDLAAGARLSISIHDISGRALQTLADGRFATGTHRIMWSGLNYYGVPVPSGLYFVVAKTRSTIDGSVRTSIARIVHSQ